MAAHWQGKTLGLVTAAILVLLASEEASAQRHHHHDAAGHMIDHAGHHTTSYGRHTGPVGVYHNQYAPSALVHQQPAYGLAYGNTGNYYSPTPIVMQTVPSNAIPQNVVPYSIQSNPGVMIVNGGPITLFNPPDSGGEVQYALNGNAYSIKPGYA